MRIALLLLFAIASASAECVRETAVVDSETGHRLKVFYLPTPATVTKIVGGAYVLQATNRVEIPLSKGDQLDFLAQLHIGPNSRLEANCVGSTASCIRVVTQNDDLWFVVYELPADCKDVNRK